MTDPVTPPDGYVTRCRCDDLPPLTVEQWIKQVAGTAQCQVCGVVWTLHWRRDPGGETQPEWTADAPPPAGWVPTTPPGTADAG